MARKLKLGHRLPQIRTEGPELGQHPKRVLLLTEEFRIHEVVLQLQHTGDLVRDQLPRAAKLPTP
jgi:hypothetical protein